MAEAVYLLCAVTSSLCAPLLLRAYARTGTRLRDLLSGALAAGTLTIALFFFRFWRQTNDRLFVFFAVAFGLLALNAAALGLTDPSGEFRVAIYGIRLAAFLVILYAIYDKNRSRRVG